MEQNIQKKTLAQQVTETLRAEILQNVLPSGSHITIQNIAQRYNTSPLPVREAFNALAGENLLELIPYKGAVIRPIDRLFFENIYDIMTALEVLSIESCIRNWTPELHECLIAANDRIRNLKTEKQVKANYSALNIEFHGLIEQFYNNSRAFELLAQYRKLVDMVLGNRARSLQRAKEAVEEHQRLIDALACGSVSEARTAFLEHGYRSRDVSLETMFGPGKKADHS